MSQKSKPLILLDIFKGDSCMWGGEQEKNGL